MAKQLASLYANGEEFCPEEHTAVKYVEARFRLPDWMLHPMLAFIREEPVVRYEEMLSWRVQMDAGVQYALFYVEADLDRYREAVGEVETVIDCRLEPIDERSAHLWVCEEIRSADERFFAVFEGRDLIVVPPVRFDEDAGMELSIVGDGAEIQRLLEDVPPDVEVRIDEIGTYDRRGGTLIGGLSDRQLEAIATAVDLGYYEVPREVSLAAVADRLGCAESTASVLLRRAERTVFERLIDRYGGTVADRSDLENLSAVDRPVPD